MEQDLKRGCLGVTFVGVAERSSERATHPHISVLKVLQNQVLYRDGLPVHLKAMALIACDGPCEDQELGEQEHVQLLEGDKYINC